MFDFVSASTEYMKTVLYNAPATINQFYDAEVRHDMYWGKDIPDR